MQVNILGNLIPSKNIYGCLEGEWDYLGNKIRFTLDADDLPLNDTINLAQNFFIGIDKYDKLCKELIVKEMLPIYNESWVDEEEGYFILTEEEFMDKIRLDGINFTGKLISLFYDDDDMFLGHSIELYSSDNLKFEDAYITLVG